MIREMEEKLKCPQCGKALRNKRALAGHMWFAHRLRQGWKWELTHKIIELERELELARQKPEGTSEVDLYSCRCPFCNRPLREHSQSPILKNDSHLLVRWDCP